MGLTPTPTVRVSLGVRRHPPTQARGHMNEVHVAMKPKECFLCGDILSEGNYSKEHVFPKWLLRRFEIFNHSLALLNGTRVVPYRSLTIPCCKRCNNEILSKIEAKIKNAVEKGTKGLKSTDWKLYIWIAKLFYGLLYKAHLIPATKGQPEGDTILPKIALDSYKLIHAFLQASRKKVVLIRPTFPGSTFVFNVQVPKEVRYQFDYRDFINSLCVSVRMGRVGIVGCLQDSSIILNENEKWLAKFQKMNLHPLQFLEISAGYSIEPGYSVVCQVILFSKTVNAR